MKRNTHPQPRPHGTRLPEKAGPPDQFLAPGLTLAMLPRLPLAQRAPRRLVTRSGYRVRGVNLIADQASRLEWESAFEANAIAVFGLCKVIDRIFSQPCVLEVEGMRYTPDLLIILRDGQRIWIECKAEADRLDQEMKHKLGAVNALLRAIGDRFVVLDSRVLADDSPVVDNCRYLSRWLDLAPPEGCNRWPAATYGELVDHHGVNQVNAALASGAWRFDMSRPLCRQTPISPSHSGDTHELAFLYA